MRYLCVIIMLLALGACKGAAVDNLTAEAEALVGMGKHAEALTQYRRAAESCPGPARCPELMLRIAELEDTALGDRAAALKTYAQITKLYPLKEAGRIAHERSAALYEKSNDYVGAAEEYAQLLRYFPAHTQAAQYLLKLGESYLAMGNFGQARIELEGLLSYDKCDHSIREVALFAYAESYFLEGRLGLAEQAYRKLLGEFPDSKLASEAKMKIATCQEERGQLGDASATMTELKKQYPNQPVIDDRLKSLEARGKEKPPDAGAH